MKKALLLFLLVLPLSTYGQEAPPSTPEKFVLYPNSVSNDELAISSDKSDYGLGEEINIAGQVQNYKSGVRVFVALLDEGGSEVDSGSVGAGKSGEFHLLYRLPADIPPGKYSVVASYGQGGAKVTLWFNILGSGDLMISIPNGAGLQENGLSLIPNSLTLYSGEKIVWVNDDHVPHRMVDGTKSEGDSQGVFDSGSFGPDETFEITLQPGHYDYFCKLHPWLVGSLDVLPSLISTDGDDSDPYFEQLVISNGKDVTLWSKSECDGCTNMIATTKDANHEAIKLASQASQYANGSNSVFRTNFSPLNINSFDFLSMAIKTGGNADLDSKIGFADHSGKVRLLYSFNSNSFPDWSGLRISPRDVISEDADFDPQSVVGLVILTPEASQMRSKQVSVYLDDLHLEKSYVSENTIKNFLDVGVSRNSGMVNGGQQSFVDGDTVLIHGSVYRVETGEPVTVRLYDPKGSLVTINQVAPNADNFYNFSIPISGDQFKAPGEYKVVVQYGIKQFKDTTSFFVLKPTVPVLVEKLYKGLDIYSNENTFYAIPSGETFDVERAKSSGYGLFFEGVSIDDLRGKIDGGPFAAPYVAEKYQGFDIVFYDGKYYAALTSLGSSIEHVMNNDGVIFEASTIEEIKSKIDTPPPPPQISESAVLEPETQIDETEIVENVTGFSPITETKSVRPLDYPLFILAGMIAALAGVGLVLYKKSKKSLPKNLDV